MSAQLIEGFRLSPQQKRLWLLQQDSPAYRAQCTCLVEGWLDEEALRAAVESVIARHEILRTTFQHYPEIKVPVQVISEECSPVWQKLDLRGLGETAQTEKIEEQWRAERARPSSLDQCPLVRVTLCTLAADKHLLLISLPALCADGWTLNNILKEISRDYAPARGGEAARDEPAQYADVAEWQHEALEDEEADAGREFWRRQSLASSPLPHVPFELAAPGELPFEVERFQIQPGEGLARRAESFARAQDTTLAALLHTCWLVLLWRHTRPTEIISGSIFAGRNFNELEDACGLFARCVPVRCRLENGQRFAALLAQVADSMSAAERWQEYWGSDDPGGDRPTPSTTPQAAGTTRAAETKYFPACFEFEARPVSYAAAGVKFSLSDQFVCFERFKLKLHCAHEQDGLSNALRLEMQYDPQHVAADSAACLGRQFAQLLESALLTPQAGIDELEIASSGERHRLVNTLNETRRDYDREILVHQLFEAQARETPARVAVVCEDRSLTYEELNRRANQLAHYLQQAGVGPEVAVGLCAERSVEMMIGLLGILKAGGAYLPLDAAQPAQRLATMLAQTASPLVVTQASLAHRFTGAQQVVCLDADAQLLSAQRGDDPASGLCGGNLVYIIFTSGSTGAPKGVAVEHRQLLNYVQAICERVKFPAASGFATVSTIAADLGNTMIFPALCNGGTLHVVAQHRVTDAAAIAEYFTRHQLDCLKIVPSHLEALQAHDRPAAVLPRRRLVLGGESSDSGWVREVLRQSPECEVFNHYGPTETTVGVLTYHVDGAGAGLSRDTLPLGKPLANVEAYILNRRMNVVGTGETGELYIGGAGITRGYIGDAEQTAQKFIPSPFGSEPGARLYRTGDLARYLPDDNIEFLGRADNQVKFHGHRVELSEIRHALNRHPEVADSVVVIKKDQKGGDVMLAFYIARRELEVATLRAFLSESIIEQTIPNFFIQLKKLPLTANGKIDYAALPTLDEARRGLKRTAVAPRTPLEELVAKTWSQVLGIGHVGIHDNFFELGGHSLLATQVISQLRESLRVEVPLHLLFESPTVAGFAARLDALRQEGGHASAPAIQRIPRDGQLPLSFAQQRLWFVDQLEPASSSYNCASAVRLTGRLDLRALEQTLNEIVRRHETLRTTFAAPEGKLVQVISPARAVDVPSVDFSKWLPAEREAEALRLINREARRPFDLAAGPLLRVMLVRHETDEHLLLLVMHHIVSDAWSLGVLVREVAALYEAFSTGNASSPLPELPIQYADFAHWQQQQSQGDEYSSHLDYWRRRLEGLPPEPALPTDFPRPDERTFAGASYTSKLSGELVDALKELTGAEGATEFMTLLAVFTALLQRETGAGEVVVGTDIANRQQAELEGLVGFFVNLLVLRTDVSGDPTLRELMGRVREVCLGAYTHQEVPFDRVVTELGGERRLNQTPLFQVLFVLQNAPMPELELGGLRLRAEELEGGSAKFDVAVFVEEEAGGGRVVRWQYSTELFREETVRRLAEGYERLLRAWVEEPDERLSRLELPSRLELDAPAVAGRNREEAAQARVAVSPPAKESPETVAAVVTQGTADARREVERKLTGIWAQVLGFAEIGVNDNFFELGGDSILSIQIIAKAYQEGLRLTTKQMFRHQTISSLAAEIVSTEGAMPAVAEQGAVTGNLPLTPIQHWFFEQQFDSMHHWNQAALLEVLPDLTADIIERAVMHLLRHHDALRLRFRRGTDGDWQQWIAAVDEAADVFARVDVSTLAGARQQQEIEARCAQWQKSLDLEHGPLVRVVFFERGAGESNRVLVVVHHLAVDGVSWRVLLEDLERVCMQLTRGEEVALPEKTTSYKLWAERLRDFARAPSAFMTEEQSYWERLRGKDSTVAGLPVDFAAGANVEDSAEMVCVGLDAEETRALLQDVPQAHHTQINDVLLTALVRAFARWTGRRSLLIELEGHGREEIIEGLDLSRTVGWFTTHFPVWLELPNTSEPGETLRAVKEQLRKIPNQGIGYGLLKHLRGDVEDGAQALPRHGEPEVRFNYLGQFDQVLSTSSPFRLATESVGALHSPAAERTCLLSINSSVSDQHLSVEWTFSRNIYRRETVEQLARDFLASLRDLIADCRSGTTGSYTPSDFPEADIDQENLNLLLEKINQFEWDNADESK
jgi:amino acid adenylation domain-containing protein/non-ribosomal peptide synthase protein (TIGR01720 family)